MNEILRVPGNLEAEQHASSNPAQSAWVSANAGSGKTHVLTQRVIRLMLEGADPSRILCLTYTKSAAAEMKQRIFETLSSWTMANETDLLAAISKLSGQEANAQRTAEARSLFASALDTPGGLKIQTIHAFCESLLHQFPLEANVPGHFEALDDQRQSELLAEARKWVLGEAVDDEPTIAEHHAFLIQKVSDSALDKGLEALVDKRHQFTAWIEENGSLGKALEGMLIHFGLSPSDTTQSLLDEALNTVKPLPSHMGNLIHDLTSHGLKTMRDAGEALATFLNNGESSAEIFETAYLAFYKKDGDIRQAISKEFENVTGLEAFCGALHAAYSSFKAKTTALERHRLNQALFPIAYRLIERYEALKRASGFVDYEDMIHKASVLLNRSEISDWIRYRLDAGIDHLLLDEAQDTSPAQWRIISALTEDFFAGESVNNRNRTLFVVGDEKQSIFSFQGARPEELALQKRSYGRKISDAGKALHDGRLGMSFRSASDILHAVDTVFDNGEARKGVTQDGDWRPHDAVKAKRLGEVQVWPLLKAPDSKPVKTWFDPPNVENVKSTDPVELLAERVALTIDRKVGTLLPGNNEPLTYKDFLVLVRKRGKFVKAFNRAMKGKAVEVAGADRLTLTDHIAVQDLLAIARAVVVPDDDFSLAAALKSIPFNLDEVGLYELAHGRANNTLLSRLRTNGRFRPLLEKYETLRDLAERVRTFEFFATLLGPLGARKAFVARLGAEAEDVLDAFMEEAVNFQEKGGAGLQRFVHDMEINNPELKREAEMERDEVRIMTVHGAKGLEARVVFLVDPNSDPFHTQPNLLRVPMGNERTDGFVWKPNKDFKCEDTKAILARLEKAAWEEYRRLLYVGMTRAEEELIVCGTLTAKGKSEGKWHALVDEALTTKKEEAQVHWQPLDGEEMPYRWRSEKNRGQSFHVGATNDTEKKQEPAVKLPDWLTSPLPPEPSLPEPLTPSGAHALIAVEDTPDPYVERPVPATGVTALDFGNAVHRLLEILPDIPHFEHAELAERYLDQIGAHWPRDIRDSAKSSVLAILATHPFEHFYGEASRAEVPVAGWLETTRGTMRISGTVDRLIIMPDRVIIVDYKTNRVVPKDAARAPDAYVTQLALYRHILASIYPDHIVEAGLLWTRMPDYMAVPHQLLDQRLNHIRNA